MNEQTRTERLGMTPDQFHAQTYDELHAQLCCAFEEIAEQVHERDADAPAIQKAMDRVAFDGSTCAVLGKDGSLQVFRFKLERL